MAEEEKNLGNECYRKKQFDQAIEHYDNALGINPEEINYINNKAAVYYEMKSYDKCIELCDEAIEKGRE